MDQNIINEKLAKLAKLEAKEAKTVNYNKEYYKNWKVSFDKMKAFYNKWNGKKIGNVELV
jgi:hypothetical protein